jgi:hypothetical protein
MMELNQGKLIDHIAAAVREGAEAVGIPCRASFLFSNRGVSTLDVARDCMCSVVHEVAGDRGISGLPFVVSMVGPFGVWTKTTQEATNLLQ